MSQPSLTSGEVAVLRVLSDGRDLRWYRPTDVRNKLGPTFPTVLVQTALSRLRRMGLAAPLYRGFETFYAITTNGESALRAADQTALFA